MDKIKSDKEHIIYKDPYEIIIEISKGSSVKYEYDNGKLTVDRFLNVPLCISI